MKKNFFALVLTAAVIIFSGCGKIPQAEIDAAKTALEQAKTSQADLYLSSDFIALQDSLNAALVTIENQKSKMFGSQGKVKEKLGEIAVMATELVTKAEVKKEEIKVEVAEAQTSVNALLEENLQLLEQAPKGKEGKEALDAIKLDLESISVSVSEVPGLISNGDLLSAQTKINAAKEKSTAINTELKTVIDKYMKKN